VGVLADKTDRVARINPVTGAATQVPVTTTADDCYIQAGQALYYQTITRTYRAVDCTSNSYGVANKMYGLTPAPCKACPTNLVAVRNASYPTSASFYTTNADGSGGFTSVRACVTVAGAASGSRLLQPACGSNRGLMEACCVY
jgi:hypothetical protein